MVLALFRPELVFIEEGSTVSTGSLHPASKYSYVVVDLIAFTRECLLTK